MAPPNTQVNMSMSITGSMIAMSRDSPSRSEWRRLRPTKTVSAVTPHSRGRGVGVGRAGAVPRGAAMAMFMRAPSRGGRRRRLR